MADRDFDLEEIAKLIKLVEKHGLQELSVEEEGTRIVVRSDVTAESVPLAATERGVLPETSAPALVPEAHANRVAVEAPMVGVFYRSSSPDQAPFADVGEHIDVGQTIGLIEAMKVFSEVPSEVAGTVVEVVASSGLLVHAGDVLLYVVPDSAS